MLYLGWDYQGFAVQEDTDKTIETALFDALLKTKLIESRLVIMIEVINLPTQSVEQHVVKSFY